MLQRVKLRSVCRLRPQIHRLLSGQDYSTRPAPLQLRGYCTQHIVASPYDAIEIPDVTVNDFVWSNCDQWADHTAVVCGLSGRGYTYSQLRERCRRFARSLQLLGLEPGTVVGVILPNTPDYPVAVLGSLEGGFVVSTFNPIYTPHEISKQLVDAGPRVLLCQPDKYEAVMEAVRLAGSKGYQSPRVVVAQSDQSSEVPPGALSLEDLADSNADSSDLTTAPVDPMSVAAIPYSSGTTGLPKGVCLSHRNLVVNCLQIKSPPQFKIIQTTTASHQDVLPAVLPFYHIYGLLSTMVLMLKLGVKIVTLPKFEANSYLEVLKEHKATVLCVVPPLVLFLGSSDDVTLEHLQHCRIVSSGAAPIGQLDAERFLKRAPKGVQFMQGYGMTETSPVILFTEMGNNKLSSAGKVVPNTVVKVVDVETGKALGPGQVGEICMQGPQVMLGYYNNPRATAEIIDPEGWLHTGDLGYYDDDRDFFIVDRIKELIKVKGFQVAPAELEELLRSHPSVSDAAVIGVPDQRAGEVPLAFVVPKNSDALGSAQLADDIKNFVAGKVSAHKRLGEVRVVASIPKNPSGKILRKELRELVQKERAGQ